jgi:Xaa-Pro aminopeptidase
MTGAKKLEALRERLRGEGLDAYIINSADAHQSEYLPEHWRARAWFTGFTGSAGVAAVTQTTAGMWTDGRYFIQAESQLAAAGAGIPLFKMNEPGIPTYREWLNKELPPNSVIGFDGRTISVTEFKRLQKDLPNIRLTGQLDLIGAIWADRPALPAGAAFEHNMEFAGLNRAEKCAKVRDCMREKGADSYFIAALDDIAWLLNIRGHDIPCTPVVYAYGLVMEHTVHVFINPAKLDPALKETLAADGFTLHPYEEAQSFLSGLNTTALYYDPERISVRMAESVPPAVKIIKGTDIIAAIKAVKNKTELENIRRAHIKEGVVMTRFLKYIDNWQEKLIAGETVNPLREADIHGILTEYREEQPHYMEPSFATIAAYKENAASMHYSPDPDSSKTLERSAFLLVDTGAQYLDGTTDITRTIPLGPLTDEMKRDFTLVLKGHIALALTQFLSGTTGVQLDAIARVPLWAAGMNYRSGTGHGLGYCLGVHEGPHNISTRPNAIKLAAGMLVTNEPGVYKEGRYGIRTENVLLVEERCVNEDGAFLGFETISLCPIDRRAIDVSLLAPHEISWLDNYHRRVYETLSPHIKDEKTKTWLRTATRPL